MRFYLDLNLNLWHFFVRGLEFFPFKFALNGQEISPPQDVKVVWLLSISHESTQRLNENV